MQTVVVAPATYHRIGYAADRQHIKFCMAAPDPSVYPFEYFKLSASIDRVLTAEQLIILPQVNDLSHPTHSNSN